jgi:hypothetical protein
MAREREIAALGVDHLRSLPSVAEVVRRSFPHTRCGLSRGPVPNESIGAQSAVGAAQTRSLARSVVAGQHSLSVPAQPGERDPDRLAVSLGKGLRGHPEPRDAFVVFVHVRLVGVSARQLRIRRCGA